MDVKKTTYQIRLEPELLREFLAAAKEADRSAAGLLREHMRQYVNTAKQRRRHTSSYF